MTALTPRTTTVLLFQGDDWDAIAERIEAVERAARSATPRRLGDDDPLARSTEDYDRFVAEATERAISVTLTALGRKRYRELLHKHPARMNEDGTVRPEDAGVGFNCETFGDDLVPASLPADMFASESERDDFLDNLSDGDFSKLYSAAVGLNQGPGPNPKARLSSHLEQTSDETSQSPARLGEA